MSSMKERVATEDIKNFKGLRQLQLHMNEKGYSAMEYDVALQIPVSETESRTILVSADQLTQIGAVTYDLNPFRTPWMNLKIGTGVDQSMNIPYNYLVQYDKLNPIQGVFIPKNIRTFMPFTSTVSNPTHINSVKTEFEPLLKDPKKIS